MANRCRTCKVEIPEMGKTGRPKKFCSEKCKLYFTNHVKSFPVDLATLDIEDCLDSEDGLRLWAKTYCLDKKGAYRRKVLEEIFGISTGLHPITKAIVDAVSQWPNNASLSPREGFKSWLNKSIREICPVCEAKMPKFHDELGVWRKYCSEKCCNIAKRSGGDIRAKMIETNIELYGDAGGNSPEVVRRREENFLKKTGYSNPMYVPGNVQRAMNTRKANGFDKISKAELEIKQFIESLGFECDHSNWSLLAGKGIDLFVPSKRLAIEYNGCYFHSEANGGEDFARKRHLEKTELCEAKGIQLLHIWEDEWVHRPEVVRDEILMGLGLQERVINVDCAMIQVPRDKIFRHSNDYLENGFIEVDVTEPNMFWTRGNCDRSKTKPEDGREYYKIFDAGNLVYKKGA